MLCDICHHNIATVHLTEIVNDKVVEMHLCQECAKSKAEEIKEQLSISDLLSGLVDKEETGKETSTPLRCSHCGLTYSDFKKKGRLGCGQCYQAFRQQLFPLLKKIHGSTQHIGKVPTGISSEVSVDVKIKELKARLEKAIRLEEYEEAARLRDEIKKLGKKKK